jgi:hypothetical protein
VIDRDLAAGSEAGQPAEQVLDNDIVHRSRAWQNDHTVYLNPFDWYIITGAGLNSAQRLLAELEAAFNALMLAMVCAVVRLTAQPRARDRGYCRVKGVVGESMVGSLNRFFVTAVFGIRCWHA